MPESGRKKFEIPFCMTCDWWETGECHIDPITLHGWPQCPKDQIGCSKHSKLLAATDIYNGKVDCTKLGSINADPRD